MRWTFGNAKPMAALGALVLWMGSACAAAPKASCQARWEQRVGALTEARPSRLPGFREMRSADGNALYLDKSCSRAFVGAVVEWSQADSLRGVERVDRARVDYSSLSSVGPAKPGEAWIFALGAGELESFAQALRPNLERQGFYLAVLGRSGEPCHLVKMDVEKLAKACQASPATALGLVGKSGSFAIDRSGASFAVSSWSDFFSGLDKKNGSR